MQNTKNAHQGDINSNTDWPRRMADIPVHRHRFYVEDHDGIAHHINDAQCPSTYRRKQLTQDRTLKAAQQFEPGVPVWECRLDLPADLDIHDRMARAQVVQVLRGLVGPWRAAFCLHDVRTLSLDPERAHTHVAVQSWERPGTGPGAWDWVRPLPLDLERMETHDEDEEEGTLYGFMWYTTRPALPGAARPDKKEIKRYSDDELKGQKAAAVIRRNTATAKARAQAKAQGKQRGHVARAFGWINEERGPRSRKALIPSSVIPNLLDQTEVPILMVHLPDLTEQKAA